MADPIRLTNDARQVVRRAATLLPGHTRRLSQAEMAPGTAAGPPASPRPPSGGGGRPSTPA